VSPEQDASPCPIYPVGLWLAGRRVVVVGGGPVAERRVRGLVVAGAEVIVISSSLTPGLRDLVNDGDVTWEERRYADGDLATAWYAVAVRDAILACLTDGTIPDRTHRVAG